jgi:DNA-binding NtrC family response regulator
MDDFGSVRVLAVSPHDPDLAVLSRILSHSAWTFLSARGVSEAGRLLQNHHVNVVLSERRLPDGDWKAVLDLTAELQEPPQLVVMSTDGDERLWAEVLNMGAWDILMKPFHPKEVYRTIHAAWQHGANSRILTASPARRTVSSEGTRHPLTAIVGS